MRKAEPNSFNKLFSYNIKHLDSYALRTLTVCVENVDARCVGYGPHAAQQEQFSVTGNYPAVSEFNSSGWIRKNQSYSACLQSNN